MLWKKKPQSKAGQEFLIDLETASAQPTPAGVKPFIKKHWKPITAAVCAAAVAAAMLIPKGGAKQASASAQYVETSPEKRNIVNSYSADGTITAADTYTVKPMVKGTVLTADFEVGDTVSVVSGAWADTVGVIQAINTPKQSVTINVELFGRETPVEIGFSDVKKM